jgi:hypothetical protein
MKIAVNQILDSATAGLEVSGMSLSSNKLAKLYTILSDGLYKDKLASIIRELFSNCWDALVMAGNTDSEILVTVPTLSTPVLSIRDHGIGLSPEEAEVTIFEFLGSNKDDSDEFIGGWGLGSKSPFSYTDAYEVVLYWNNRRYEYNCWKDEDGMPQKACFHATPEDEPTGEPNGVEVRVPILTSDVYECTRVLKTYLARTRYPFRVINPQVCTVIPFATLWSSAVNDRTVSIVEDVAAGIYIYYGGFTYSLDDIQWPEGDAARIALWKGCLTARRSIYLHAKVGDCNFSVSRESLAGTKMTYAWVLSMLKGLSQQLDENANLYVQEYLQPLLERYSDPEFGKVRSAITVLEVCGSQHLTNSPEQNRFELFKHFSFHKWTQQLSENDGQFFLDVRSRHNAQMNMFSVLADVTLPSGEYLAKFPAHKKPSNLRASMRSISLKSRGHKASGSASHKVLLNQVYKMSLNLAQPLAEQVVLLWSANNYAIADFAHVSNANSARLPRYPLLVSAPDAATATAFYASLGFSGLPVDDIESNSMGLDPSARVKKNQEKRDSVHLPVFIQCMESGRRFEYRAGNQYCWADPEDKKSYEMLKKFPKRSNFELVVPSATFIKKYAGALSNFTRISPANFPAYFKVEDRVAERVLDRALGAHSLDQTTNEVAHSVSRLSRELLGSYHPELLTAAGLNIKSLQYSNETCHKIAGSMGYADDRRKLVEWARDRMGVHVPAAIPKLVYPVDKLQVALSALKQSYWCRTVRWDELKNCPREMRLVIIAEALKELNTISASTGNRS